MSLTLSHSGALGDRPAFTLAIPFARIVAVLAAAATALLVSSSAKAQDFDCASAKLVAERTICNSPRLIRLDNRLAGLYGRLWARLDNDNREGLRDHQLAFLKTRNLCNRDVACIDRTYRRQVRILESRLVRH